jgi:hypothetical protein
MAEDTYRGAERIIAERRVGWDNRKTERRSGNEQLTEKTARTILQTGRPIRSGSCADRREGDRRSGIDRRTSGNPGNETQEAASGSQP